MRKTIVVAVREYQAAVRTKAFIISLLAMPIIMGGSILAQVMLRDTVDTRDRKFAVVDFSGQLYSGIETAASKRNEEGIFRGEGEERKKVQPRFLPTEIEPTSEDLDQLKFDLSQRVRSKEYFAFVIIQGDPTEVVAEEGGLELTYYSNTPTYSDLRRWLKLVCNNEVKHIRFARVGIDRALVESAMKPVRVQDLLLVTRDETGKITRAQQTNRGVNIGVPIGMMMLMFMVVMVGASPLVQSVLEEKMQRIAEVLLGSVPPFQLMMGKLLGTVGVSLTISMFYLAGTYAALSYAGHADAFPVDLLCWFVLYQALAVLMYGSMFIAVGAAVSDMKESQSLMMPVMILVMAPMFLWGNVLKAPTATFAVAVSLFPPATPMLMLLRQAIPPGVPAWQPGLGIVGVIITTAIFVFVAGRIFRVGILMQGKGAKLGEMLRWAIRG